MTVVLAFVPDIGAAQALDPALLTEPSGAIRAVASFGLVLVFGAVVLARYGEIVDASVSVSMGHPGISLLYGCIAYALVVVVGTIGILQFNQLGVLNGAILLAAAAIVATAVLVLAGLGYAVVGAWLTGLYGSRNPWNGLVFGAGLGALGWALLPPIPGALVWIAIGAVGIGGPVRGWIHDERSVKSHQSG
jgi:quinol-cytochrome oxidoreductase complex cytochrome b subunit